MGKRNWLMLFWLGAFVWTLVMNSCTCDFGGHETPDENDGPVDDGFKSEDDRNLRCIGAKCECDDKSLKTKFYGTVGHVVANCRLNKLYTEKKKQGLEPASYHEATLNSPIQGTTLHDEACEIMRIIGEKFVKKDFDGMITSCCEYRERITTFQCLHTYLTLAELKKADKTQDDSLAEEDKLAEHLEETMLRKCDRIFKSPSLLIQGILDNLQDMQVNTDPDQPIPYPDDAGDTVDSIEDTKPGTEDMMTFWNKLAGNYKGGRKPIGEGHDGPGDMNDKSDAKAKGDKKIGGKKTGKTGRTGRKGGRKGAKTGLTSNWFKDSRDNVEGLAEDKLELLARALNDDIVESDNAGERDMADVTLNEKSLDFMGHLEDLLKALQG